MHARDAVGRAPQRPVERPQRAAEDVGHVGLAGVEERVGLGDGVLQAVVAAEDGGDVDAVGGAPDDVAVVEQRALQRDAGQAVAGHVAVVVTSVLPSPFSLNPLGCGVQVPRSLRNDTVRIDAFLPRPDRVEPVRRIPVTRRPELEPLLRHELWTEVTHALAHPPARVQPLARVVPLVPVGRPHGVGAAVVHVDLVANLPVEQPVVAERAARRLDGAEQVEVAVRAVGAREVEAVHVAAARPRAIGFEERGPDGHIGWVVGLAVGVDDADEGDGEGGVVDGVVSVVGFVSLMVFSFQFFF